MIFVGVDWAEDHHDICVMDEDGSGTRRRGSPTASTGVGELHELVAEHAEETRRSWSGSRSTAA